MTVRDQYTLEVEQVSRTADRLARRMGGHYVLNREWCAAYNGQQHYQTEPQSIAGLGTDDLGKK